VQLLTVIAQVEQIVALHEQPFPFAVSLTVPIGQISVHLAYDPELL